MDQGRVLLVALAEGELKAPALQDGNGEGFFQLGLVPGAIILEGEDQESVDQGEPEEE